MSQRLGCARDRKVRILIADDHAPIRRLVRLIIEEDSRFEVCGEAVNGAQAIARAEELDPDVVILNINMPVLSGLAAAREINTRLPNLAVVILSSEADKHFIEEAKKVGARGYVHKMKAEEALISAIDSALVSDSRFVIIE
jgi:DNA-binding NarL/FixJ family response regulator